MTLEEFQEQEKIIAEVINDVENRMAKKVDEIDAIPGLTDDQRMKILNMFVDSQIKLESLTLENNSLKQALQLASGINK